MIQLFGEEELIDHIANGGEIYSHLISIGNPRNLFHKRRGEFVPDIFKTSFKKILRLSFFDSNEKRFSKKVPELADIKKIIRFFESTKSEASGYTIHCWRGVSRSTAVALCVLYMMTKSEDKAKQMLLKARPEAIPLKRVVELFDLEYGSSLSRVQQEIQGDWIDKMKRELDFNPDDYLEELESV